VNENRWTPADGDLLAAATQLNSVSWETANRHFNQHKGDFATVLRSGSYQYPEPVLEALDLQPQTSVLHLLCNDGREAAAWSMARSCLVRGIDVSLAALEFARQLNDELSLSNDFVADDAVSFLESDARCYDRIVLTLGSIRWIPDLPRLMHLSHERLNRSGSLVLWDFHPLIRCLSQDAHCVHDYPMPSRTFLRPYGVVDYLSDEDNYKLVHRDNVDTVPYESVGPVVFSEHSLGHVVTSAVGAGLRIRDLQELPFSWEERALPWLTEHNSYGFVTADGFPQLPVTFLLRAATGAGFG
jgi:SAM-dependent methyltransferase